MDLASSRPREHRLFELVYFDDESHDGMPLSPEAIVKLREREIADPSAYFAIEDNGFHHFRRSCAEVLKELGPDKFTCNRRERVRVARFKTWHPMCIIIDDIYEKPDFNIDTSRYIIQLITKGPKSDESFQQWWSYLRLVLALPGVRIDDDVDLIRE